MKRLALVAHFNPLGRVAPHVLRQLQDLSRTFDRVVLASTSTFTPEDRTAISPYAEILERANVGQDFGSWHEALQMTDFAADYDELLLTNDSYVQLVPVESMITKMQSQPVEMWGATRTWRRGEHIQSYFLYFSTEALKSATFTSFWDLYRPAVDRKAAIAQQELGISLQMREAGFRLGSYFEPTTAEMKRASRRGTHWLQRRRHRYPSKFLDLVDSDFDVSRRRDPRESRFLNPSTVYADSVFDNTRFPLVKFDTLRYDPYWLDSAALLSMCEARFPNEFDGVREYIDATASFYPGRRWENDSSSSLSALQRRRVGYTSRQA
ncbi:rhamnosyltransferase [Microbacterium endophyticum]|uniref:Rhamnosyltransferase n=1 Tax=Microbacterium endophyticum TaxID=1526412 RepID=A0A7W4V3T8_9MICO|nr:rhamnan synthesis F family protein [Microbacterium endophyticum]MBB2976332.1 rhamnosyltransferase [Microbacterium endophyticum]NIK35212.1 rhamnosyltransferase [Microbacterium endophyticum]